MRPCAFTFLLLLLATLLPIAQADATAQTYTIPLFGARWNIYTITVSIPKEPWWAHQGVLDAMTIWNQSQAWFINTYYPNSRAYDFVEQEKGKVTIVFVTKPIIFGNTLAAGYTQNVNSKDNVILKSTITIDITTQASSRYHVEVVAAHEIGHALGLDHTHVAGDLMELWSVILYGVMQIPSTLDLYAVHLLAENKMPKNKTVILPSEIPYKNAEQVIPEFSVSMLILAVTFCAVSFLSVSGRLRRRERPQEQRRLLLPG